MTTDFRPIWKYLVNKRVAHSYHVAQYIALQSLHHTKWNVDRAVDRALKKINKAFTETHNRNKLDNGVKPLDGALRAIAMARLEASVRGRLLDAPAELLSKEQYGKYIELLGKLHDHEKIQEFFGRSYVYIFVRQDISPEYQLVQAAHVAMKTGWQIRNGQTIQPTSHHPDNLYFTIIGVANQDELQKAVEKLKSRGITHTEFIEPDIGNQVTAVASFPILVRDRGNLLNYKLLKFSQVT